MGFAYKHASVAVVLKKKIAFSASVMHRRKLGLLLIIQRRKIIIKALRMNGDDLKKTNPRALLANVNYLGPFR